MESRGYERVHEGMDACDVDGDKIGKAETIGQRMRACSAPIGVLRPFLAMTEVVDNAVYLNVDNDDLPIAPGGGSRLAPELRFCKAWHKACATNTSNCPEHEKKRRSYYKCWCNTAAVAAPPPEVICMEFGKVHARRLALNDRRFALGLQYVRHIRAQLMGEEWVPSLR